MQGLAFIPEGLLQHREMLCRWVPAFSRTLMCHVRKDGDVARELQSVLLPHELEELLRAQHRPNYVLQVGEGRGGAGRGGCGAAWYACRHAKQRVRSSASRHWAWAIRAFFLRRFVRSHGWFGPRLQGYMSGCVESRKGWW
jgi:hypothetical protein